MPDVGEGLLGYLDVNERLMKPKDVEDDDSRHESIPQSMMILDTYYRRFDHFARRFDLICLSPWC